MEKNEKQENRALKMPNDGSQILKSITDLTQAMQVTRKGWKGPTWITHCKGAHRNFPQTIELNKITY